MYDEVQQQMIFSLPRTYLSYCHQTHKTISEFTTKLISHYEPVLSVICTIWNVTSVLSFRFFSFWIRSTSNLNFRRSIPIFHTYMVTNNSIHLYIYTSIFRNPLSTEGKSSLTEVSIADMYINVTQYLQNMQRVFDGASPQLRLICSFCSTVLIIQCPH